MNLYGQSKAQMASDERLIDSTAAAYRRGGEGDAYDFFTRQLAPARKAPKALTNLVITLFCVSCVLFLAALTLLLVMSTASWSVALFATACALSLIATALGTFAPTR